MAFVGYSNESEVLLVPQIRMNPRCHSNLTFGEDIAGEDQKVTISINIHGVEH